MTRKPALLLLAASLLQAANAHADSIKDALNHKYKHHVLALRSPFIPGYDQKFNSAGQLLNAASTSAWLLYGGIYVEKLNLSSETLRVQGPLAAFADEKIEGQHRLVRFSKSQQIEIHFDRPPKSLDDAEAVMGRIFFSSVQMPQSMPSLSFVAPTTPLRTTKFTTTIKTVLKLPKPHSHPNPIFLKKHARQNFREK